MPSQNPTISLSLDMQHPNINAPGVRHEMAFKIPMPTTCSDSDIKVMQRDFELMAKLIKEHPQKIKSLMEAVAKGDSAGTAPLIKTLGLSEAEFQQQGGGWLWIVVGGAVLLYGSIAK